MDDEAVRLLIYRTLATTGVAPTVASVATHVGESPHIVQRTFRALHDARHIVLDDADRILMAHPFATIPLGFSVMGARTLWWGGCAWDSFAIPHLVADEPDVLVATRCPGCDAPLAWTVTRSAPPDGDEVAHFLVPASHIWDDVVHTCGHQRLFCDEGCVDAWLAASANERGYVMDLATLWRLAQGWYAGRLDSPYRRREPAEATGYFRAVGLDGPFWGL